MGDARNASDVQSISGEVGAVGADHRSGIGTHKALKVGIVHQPPPVGRNKVQLHAPLLLQPIQRAQDGVVLAVRGDHMVAFVDKAIDGDVQRLGRIGRKNHMIRPLTSEKPCQLFPHSEHCSGGLQRPAVSAAGGVAHGGHGVQHSLRHLGRLVQRGGGVIQIDHGFPLPFRSY